MLSFKFFHIVMLKNVEHILQEVQILSRDTIPPLLKPA